MCYGCSPTCDNCRPKVVTCAECERINYLSRDECAFCGEKITQAMKDAAIEDWNHGIRMDQLVKAPQGPHRPSVTTKG